MKVIYKLVKFISSIFSTFLITIFITTTNAKAGVEEGIDIRRVQTILTELCYNPGPIDGAWGRKTEIVKVLLTHPHLTFTIFIEV
jgi:hypothetical protein